MSDVYSKFRTEAKSAIPEQKKEIAGFVSTSVLVSKDGLFGEDTEEQRIAKDEDDAQAHRKQTAPDDGRTLFERLQEEKERKEAEWKEKHNPFQPPKALDDEEVQFLEEEEERRRERERSKREQEKRDFEAFELARLEMASRTVRRTNELEASDEELEKSTATASTSSDIASKEKELKQPKVEVRVKRKSAKKPRDHSHESHTAESNKKKKKTNKMKDGKPNRDKSPPNGGGTGSSALSLVGYGSESDDE